MKNALFASVWGALVAATAALMIVVAFTSGTARAQEVSFRATATAAPVGNDGRYGVFSLTGTASQLGSFEGSRITWKQGASTVGNVTLASARGDSINFYTEVVFDKQDIQANGRYVITGGTGRFQGATGAGSFAVGPVQDGSRALTWSGSLSY